MTPKQMAETLFDQAQKYAKYVFVSEVSNDPLAALKELGIAWKNFQLLMEDKPIQDLIKKDKKVHAYIYETKASFARFQEKVKQQSTTALRTPDALKSIASQFTALLRAEKMTADALRKQENQWIPWVVGIGAGAALWMLLGRKGGRLAGTPQEHHQSAEQLLKMAQRHYQLSKSATIPQDVQYNLNSARQYLNDATRELNWARPLFDAKLSEDIDKLFRKVRW
jgi:hypothetical protein